MIFKPQPGFQTDFLSCTADICIGGGAAGVGKTYAELLEPIYHKHIKDFTAMIFRRTSVQIRNPGGLWDKSADMYRRLGAKPREQQMDWVFPSGALVKFSHLEYESNVYDHQGSEYCLIIFDELTHFTKKQFFYLLSRNRSMCGVKPYIRATCNPDPDSFVAELISWWIDPETGYPIRERAGVHRYFLVDNDNYVWGDSKQEVIDKCPHIFDSLKALNMDQNEFVKSITFIPGDIYENKKLLNINPAYMANLMAQSEEEQIRLLRGNWKIRTDLLSLMDYAAIENLFHNSYPANTNNRYITVDAARFGNDFLTAFVWFGWRVVKLVIMTKCDANTAVAMLERERKTFNILKGNVMVDQDGVGDGIVKLGSYKGFHGGHAPYPVREVKDKDGKENYVNRKTQCYYRFADRVNRQEVALDLNSENVIIDGVYGVKILYNGKIVDVRDMIKQDLRAIKKKSNDQEGKLQINSKEQQKIILNGRSPDFGDGLSIREALDLISPNIVVGNTKGSILDRI